MSSAPARAGRAVLAGILFLVASAGAAAEETAAPPPSPSPAETGTAQDTPPPPAAGGPAPGSPPESGGDVFKPLGPSLFPFYQHYLRTADSTEVRNILYLYTATGKPDGSWSRLLVPIFYRSHVAEPPQDLFYIFPLLFFHKESEKESFNYALPIYYERRTEDAYTRFLFPLWYHTADRKSSTDHVLFPLFRRKTEVAETGETLRRSRFGLWKVLELWESRADPQTTERAALNFFNWSAEAQGGLAVYRSSWASEEGVARGKTHLFPFYWHGESAGFRYRWLFPFYGRMESPGQSDLFIPILLSRIGGSSEGERRLDILFPFYHYARGPKSYSIASYPFFDYHRDEAGTSGGLLFWLYRTSWKSATGKRIHSILFPLAHYDVEPDGSKGSRWFFPYIETFDDKSLWRFGLPLYFERQALAGGKTDSFVRVGLPLFLSFGHPDDYFSMGFPLFWASRNGPRGWEVFLPLYYRFYSATSSRLHLLPFFSYRSFPSRKQTFVLGPLYVNERFYDLDGNRTGTGHHFLWPFLGYERRDDGYKYRFLPFFSIGRRGDTTSRLLTPFYYESESPRGKHRYFIPAYGRYEDERIRRDFYAAGTYIRTTEKDAAGAPVRERDDILWSLASQTRDLKTGGYHEHVYPFLYWKTRTPAQDRTVVGPLYYSHRISEGDEVDRLKLVMGNVFLSIKKEGRLPDEPPPQPEPEVPAEPAARPLPQPRIGETYSDQGVLWPLSRSYRTAKGEEGKWVIPFYFKVKDELSKNFALFPFYFRQEETTQYNPSYFRYFFLFDRETWRGGRRTSLGQILFDWKAEEASRRYRLRILYPILEHAWNPEGYEFSFTPFVRLSARERSLENRFFPFFWQGRTERKSAAGDWRLENRHFFLFPLLGFSSKGVRRDAYVLFPLFHLRRAPETLQFELWPLVFYRNEPSLHAVRLWPFHADESGVSAGDFWVSRVFFLSKRFETPQGYSYRLDPLLFRIRKGADELSIGALFEALAYRRKGNETSYRAIPLVFGYSKDETSAMGIIPFHYRKDFGKEEIDYAMPWRFLFLTNSLRGASGERHTGVLWKLFEYTDNPNRPEYEEVKVLERLFFKRRTETSRQLEVNPLFSYYRDETADETAYSILLNLYGQRTVRGRTTHTILFFIRF